MISTGDVRKAERKDAIVREELAFGATGLPVVRQGITPGSYALRDKL